jgi:formylmethanofuran dehydrogenase subunit E
MNTGIIFYLFEREMSIYHQKNIFGWNWIKQVIPEGRGHRNLEKSCDDCHEQVRKFLSVTNIGS